MARIARVVSPGIPHHITQRGNRRQPTFFLPEDYEAYLALMSEWCQRKGVAIWSYCLMPNHVHLVAVPQSEEGLRVAIGEAHRRYTRRVNFRMGWRGHLWQGRFASYPMDEGYLLAAARYVELNPVKAGMVERAEDYSWSSAAHHVDGRSDPLVRESPLKEMVGDWRAFLYSGDCEETSHELKRAERTGRPLGSPEFILFLEKALGRPLQRLRPGPKSMS